MMEAHAVLTLGGAVDRKFRALSRSRQAAPKAWADA
jgi:hypothetical protein